MFDIAWSELLVIAVVTLIAVGPKDLPKVLRTVAQMMRKARGFADEFRTGVRDMMDEVERDDVKKSIHHVSNFDPRTRDEPYVDPTGQFPQPLRDPAPSSANEAGGEAKNAEPTDPIIDPIIDPGVPQNLDTTPDVTPDTAASPVVPPKEGADR